MIRTSFLNAFRWSFLHVFFSFTDVQLIQLEIVQHGIIHEHTSTYNIFDCLRVTFVKPPESTMQAQWGAFIDHAQLTNTQVTAFSKYTRDPAVMQMRIEHMNNPADFWHEFHNHMINECRDVTKYWNRKKFRYLTLKRRDRFTEHRPAVQNDAQREAGQ